MSDQSEPKDWYSADHATFGDRLTAAREAQGMSVSKLASRLGVKVQTLQGWENDRSEPRANKLQMLAGVLNVSMRWLLTGEGEGLAEPIDPEELAEDADALLKEMREMRAEMTRMVTRIGRAEKRLRLILREAI